MDMGPQRGERLKTVTLKGIKKWGDRKANNVKVWLNLLWQHKLAKQLRPLAQWREVGLYAEQYDT